jgi:predicted dehydrogenase
LIRVAVVGAGHWGPNLIRNFDNQRTSEVRWVVDRDPSRLTNVRAHFPVTRTTTSLAETLADPAVDAVVIATPTSTHYALSHAALSAGKHVLVEKPIATSLGEGQALFELAKQRDLTLMVGHLFLFNVGVRRIKALLDAGELGRIYYASMVRTNLGPIRSDVNAAWDLAAHDISIANHWLGSAPLGVSAVGGAWLNPGVEDTVFATLRYPEGVLVNLHVSWLSPRKSREIVLVGARKMVTFDDNNLAEPMRVYDKSVHSARTDPDEFVDSFASFRASIREGEIHVPELALGEPLKTECDHFLECIRERRAPLSGAHESLAVLRTLEALTASVAERGREQAVR